VKSQDFITLSFGVELSTEECLWFIFQAFNLCARNLRLQLARSDIVDCALGFYFAFLTDREIFAGRWNWNKVDSESVFTARKESLWPLLRLVYDNIVACYIQKLVGFQRK
jgi:hypothetical protein